jgi:hypothetical protein
MKALLTLVAALLAATALAVSASAAERYVPGVTDFPSVSQSERYVPFVTDFPNRVPEAAPTGVGVATDGSAGLDAAVGVALGLAFAALAAAALPAMRRRRSVSSA